MAVDTYLFLQDYGSDGAPGAFLSGDSQAPASLFSGIPVSGNPIELTDWALDVEQTLNIGSGSSGAGAGKIAFNPLSISKPVDSTSPVLFQHAAAGTPFAEAFLLLVKSDGGSTAGSVYLQYLMKLVAVKTISWAYGDEGPSETVTFEYGALELIFQPQSTTGAAQGAPVTGAWNVVTNTGAFVVPPSP